MPTGPLAVAAGSLYDHGRRAVKGPERGLQPSRTSIPARSRTVHNRQRSGAKPRRLFKVERR